MFQFDPYDLGPQDDTDARAERWVRRGRVAALVYVALCAGLGMLCLFGWAWQAGAGAILATLLATLVAVGLGAVAMLCLTMMSLLAGNTAQTEKLRRRMESLETSFEMWTVESGANVELGADMESGADMASGTVVEAEAGAGLHARVRAADETDTDHHHRSRPTTSSRVRISHDEIDDHLPSPVLIPTQPWHGPSGWSIVSADQQDQDRGQEQDQEEQDRQDREDRRAEPDRLTQHESSAMRDTFREMVRSRRYDEAIVQGDRITEQFPDSRMAADFKALRPRLLHLAIQTPSHRAAAQ